MNSFLYIRRINYTMTNKRIWNLLKSAHRQQTEWNFFFLHIVRILTSYKEFRSRGLSKDIYILLRISIQWKSSRHL